MKHFCAWQCVICASALVHVHSGQLDPSDPVCDVGPERLVSNYSVQQGTAAVELGLYVLSSFLRPEFSPMTKPLCSGSFGESFKGVWCMCVRLCAWALKLGDFYGNQQNDASEILKGKVGKGKWVVDRADSSWFLQICCAEPKVSGRDSSPQLSSLLGLEYNFSLPPCLSFSFLVTPRQATKLWRMATFLKPQLFSPVRRSELGSQQGTADCSLEQILRPGSLPCPNSLPPPFPGMAPPPPGSCRLLPITSSSSAWKPQAHSSTDDPLLQSGRFSDVELKS